MMGSDFNRLAIIAEIRRSIINMVHSAKASHVGSCLSVVEILYVLYFMEMNINPDDPSNAERDKLILSKGHASAALYATLAERGFFDKNLLKRFVVDGGLLPGHLDMDTVPGVEISGGSLGHGLSIGVGMAIVNATTSNPGRIFVVLGDGECNEGSVWEAAMLASRVGLRNLTAVIDYNKLQGFCRSQDITGRIDMRALWEAFGWETYEVDGHDVSELERIFKLPQHAPKAVIAHTIKGKGISFMEDRLEWHYCSPDKGQCERALKELDESV